MRRMKRRIFSGPVCEQYCYNVADCVKEPTKYERKPRFETEEDRKTFNENVSRLRHARSFNANFGPSSYFSTLTCDVEHELYDFKDAKRLAKNYMRRLHRKYPDSRIQMWTGRGRTTHRIHFHMVSEGVPEEYIKKQWDLGSIKRIDHLREHNRYDGVDHGKDYTGLANYLFAHWTPEVGGAHYMRCGKFVEPEKEDAKECRRRYDKDHPPIAPKGYTLVETRETKYGFIYFKYVALPVKRKYTRKNRGEEPLC